MTCLTRSLLVIATNNGCKQDFWARTDAIKSDMDRLNLRVLPAEQLPISRLMEKRETASFVNTEDVIVTVIPIVGFGGFGKTTLAQLIFNHERVKQHFNLTKWAYVPEKDNSIVIMGKSPIQITSGLVHVNLLRPHAPMSLVVARRMRPLYLDNDNNNNLEEAFSRFQYLRVLSIAERRIEELPNSIGKLMHLILRHLLLHSSSHDLIDLPSGLRKMTSLQVLNRFIVGKNNGIDALPSLNLKRNLTITFKERRTNAISEAQRANLKNNDQLTNLCLRFEYRVSPPSDETNEMLKHLQLPPNLKRLHVCKYSGDEMPSRWLDGLSKLCVVRILDCPKLKYLKIDCDNIKYLPGSITRLENLHTLNIIGCRKLKELPSDLAKLTNLRHLLVPVFVHPMFDLPSGIGKMTSLHVLNYFIVGKNNGIDALPPLNFKGTLHILFKEWRKKNAILEMAEGVIADLLVKALEALGTAAFKKAASWWGARDELKELEKTMRLIQARVHDAEMRQEADSGKAIKEWLRRLRLVLYQADDLFDEVLIRHRQKQRMQTRMSGKVGILFSRSGPLYFNRKLANEIKSIRKELDAIKSVMDGLNLRVLPAEELPRARLIQKRETASFVNIEDCIGRDNDQNAIFEMLFDTKFVNDRLVSSQSWGLGVSEKQLLLNWFSIIKGLSSISILLHGPMSLRKTICISESIEAKKYLLVLDDLWDEGGDRLIDLMNLLKCGKRGSKVIVTTRSDVVAKSIGTISAPYKLGCLAPHQSWDLFKRLAFTQENQHKNPIFTEIGKEIVIMCGDVPLAIKSYAIVVCC
ncbi:putative disease resistance protein RGA4 [Bienertia sinuspersici]